VTVRRPGLPPNLGEIECHHCGAFADLDGLYADLVLRRDRYRDR